MMPEARQLRDAWFRYRLALDNQEAALEYDDGDAINGAKGPRLEARR
jgi:hypothetical protein